MITLVGAVFIASLLGSAHCAGMCTPFVCFYAGADTRASGWGHLAYNGGRLVSYLILGAIAGAVGAGIQQVGYGVGVSRAAASVAGILMIAWGVVQLLVVRGVKVPTPTPLAGAQRWMAARLRDVKDFAPTARALTVGLLTTLLPCGWLYAFVITAAGTGSVADAMLVMAVFWAGTLPMMLAIGVGIRRLAGPLRDRLPVFSAIVLVVIGLYSLSGGIQRDPSKIAMRARHMIPATLQPADSARGAAMPATHDAMSPTAQPPVEPRH
ncbi:MAG: sulfite exporter TauE/SafE family protein [Gemmatimonadaceae bacterium]|nr:sulfite exporter TauE/SafE family protein [Gemmatimonadaceae bacterium]